MREAVGTGTLLYVTGCEARRAQTKFSHAVIEAASGALSRCVGMNSGGKWALKTATGKGSGLVQVR